MSEDEKKLTDKQERFCLEYLTDLNATQAAIRTGYKPNSAREQACRMLTKDNISKRITELKAEIADRNNVKIDDLVQELKAVGFSNIKDYITVGEEESVVIKAFDQLSDEKAKAIGSIKKTTTRIAGELQTEKLEFKLHDKLAALDKLCRHVGFFKADNKHEVNGEVTCNVKIGVSGKVMAKKGEDPGSFEIEVV